MHRKGPLAALRNQLIFADWSFDFRKPSGQLFAAAETDADLWSFEKIATLDTRIVALVQDSDGLKYIMTNDNFGPYGSTGKIFQLDFNGQ